MKPRRPTTAAHNAHPLTLQVSYAARRPWVPSAAQFKRWAHAALAGVNGPAVLSIRVVGATRSRQLNDRYRGKPKPTNVLSFTGAGHAPDGQWYVGELVLCAAIVAREAQTQHKALRAHWAHLTVHGVLHLLGFDHKVPQAARRMEALEVQVLEKMGIPDPYRYPVCLRRNG